MLKKVIIKKQNNKVSKGKKKLSDKYRGILSKEDGKELQQHITQMRNEW